MTPSACLCAADRALPAVGCSGIEGLLRRAMAGTRTPALAAVELRAGRVECWGALGLCRNDGLTLVGCNEPWLIGPAAKPMTAALVARLVEQGLLDWTMPLPLLLPQLKSQMRAEYLQMDLRGLLSQRSGLGDYHGDCAGLTRLDYASRLLGERPLSRPGAVVRCTDAGFMLAALAAEQHTGLRFEALLRRELDIVSGQPTRVRGHKAGQPLPDAAVPRLFEPVGEFFVRPQDWAQFALAQMQLAGGSAALGWSVQSGIAGSRGPAWVHAGTRAGWYSLAVMLPDSGDGGLVLANAGPDMGGDRAAAAAMLALLLR